MLKKKSLTHAVRAAAGLMALSALPATTVFAQDDAAQEIVVTGSRINRTDYQEGSQVVTMDRDDIDALGSLIISDVLRASPLNTYGSFSERSGSTAQSNATFNLRGLGDQRSLVMINERRMVGSPNMGAAVTNINMIPMAAVERVDILADGASAVYGSDAVAGVVNLKMRDNFEGLEFSTRYGDRSNDDGNEYNMSMIAGFSSDRGNVTMSIETNKRDPIFDRDREYTSAWTRDNNGDGNIDAYVDTDGYSIYGKSIWLYDPNTGYDRILAANSCAEGDGFLAPVDADIDWGYPDSLDENTYCMFGYADVSANKAKLDRTSSFISTTYQLSDNVDFYTNTLISRVESFGRYAPAAATWDDMPADYADVPFDIDALLASGEISPDYSLTGFYRWTNVGNRDNYVTDTQIDFTAGLRGDLAPGVSFDTYVQQSRYDVKEFGEYYLSYPGLDYVFAQGIDPFSEEGAGAMSAVTTQDNLSEMFKAYGHVQYGLGDWLAGGETLALTGVEYIELAYKNKFDRQSEVGLVGGSAGNSSEGDRDIYAVFSEVMLPVTDNIELNAAFRYDQYSDFGNAFSPTLSATWSVTDTVTLRGRWGEGFRAPGFDELYGATTFSAESASDQLTCQQNSIAPEDCSSSQYDTWFSTNPDLDAEESESVSIGANWVATDWLTLDLSYWDITIDNVIEQSDTQSVFYAEAAGHTFAPGSGTYVDRQGGRAVVYSSYENQGQLAAKGIDFQTDTGFDTDLGFLSASALVTYNLSYKQQSYFAGPIQETAGFNLQPELKLQLGFGWDLQGHSVDLIVDHVGESSEQDFINFDSAGNAFLATSEENLDSWTTLNLSYGYDTGKYGRFRIGGRNITNEDPVLDRTGKYDVTHYDLYDNTGRVWYAEYTVDF